MASLQFLLLQLLVASYLVAICYGTALRSSIYFRDPIMYTSYTKFNREHKVHVVWSTNGHNQTFSGQFGGGILGPFSSPCSVATSITNGKVFILDSLVNATVSSVVLSIYNQVESNVPSMTLLTTIQLPRVHGGLDAKCFMATLGKFVYVGTDKGNRFAKVNWETFEFTEQSNYVPPSKNTSSITVNNNVVLVVQTNTIQFFNEKGISEIIGGGSTNIVASNEGSFF